jgi:hypothetical protein
LAKLPDGDLAEGPEPAQDIDELVHRPSPDRHRPTSVHDELKVEPSLTMWLDNGEPKAVLGDSVRCCDLIDRF